MGDITAMTVMMVLAVLGGMVAGTLLCDTNQCQINDQQNKQIGSEERNSPFVVLEQDGEYLSIVSAIVTEDAIWTPDKPIIALDDLEVNNSYYSRVTFFLPSSFVVNENSTYALKIEDAGKSTIIKIANDEWYHVNILKKSDERYCAKLVEINPLSAEKILDYSGVGCYLHPA